MRVPSLAACAAAALLLSSPAQTQTVDVLALAQAGHLDCYSPNAEARTCRALSRYEFVDGGAAMNVADVNLGGPPVIVMRSQSAVVVTSDAICGEIKQADLDAATFTMGGAPMSAEDDAAIRTVLLTGMAGMLDQEVCVRFRMEGETMLSEASLGGAELGPPEPVIWVRPEDGWRVE
ncbi:MAG: hypothetical protein GC206_16235 [Alphaproteobacteria bacterium]|nr:hypothetical protein [Alphaproteobacteria bacterium]